MIEIGFSAIFCLLWAINIFLTLFNTNSLPNNLLYGYTVFGLFVILSGISFAVKKIFILLQIVFFATVEMRDRLSLSSRTIAVGSDID